MFNFPDSINLSYNIGHSDKINHTLAIAIVALFAFTQAWNEFLYALVFVYSDAARTLSLFLRLSSFFSHSPSHFPQKKQQQK